MATKQSDASDHLITLIINQNEVTDSWLKFLITVQAGLAIAFQFIMTTKDNILSTVGYYIIPALGIVVTLTVMRIILRQRRWQAWYVNRYNALPDNLGKVFPTKDDRVDDQPHGFIARQIVWLSVALILLWTAVAVYRITAAYGQTGI